MDINLLKKLIKMVEQSEVTEFSVQEGDLKVKISKNSKGSAHVNLQPSFDYSHQVAHAPGTIKQTSDLPAAAVPSEVKSNVHEIKSPIVGTFYRAPAPDADPYIQVGDHVSPGTVLCIVEAMKLMNEIESDVSGRVIKMLVDNATPVEYNQPLFLIERS